MIERRNKTRGSCTEAPLPCTIVEFYAIGLPLACLLGAGVAVVLSWL